MSSRADLDVGTVKYDLSEISKDPRFFDTQWLTQRWTSSFRLTKRLVDIVFSLPLALVGLLSLPLIAIAIRIDSWGPIFYLQTRVGKDGKTFNVIKYRSMVVDAERHGARFASVNDARITRVGALLRRTRLDEVPQVINVLRGEMSLVGPRPERPHVIDSLVDQVPLFDMRTLVKPGLTGWAQVKGAYAANETQLAEKLEYDLYYIRNASLGMDLSILIETLSVVLRRKGV